MIQTKLLLFFAGLLLFLIGVVSITKSIQGHQGQATEKAAKLCSSYYDYVDVTHKVIPSMDSMCWRGDAPSQGRMGGTIQ